MTATSKPEFSSDSGNVVLADTVEGKDRILLVARPPSKHTEVEAGEIGSGVVGGGGVGGALYMNKGSAPTKRYEPISNDDDDDDDWDGDSGRGTEMTERPTDLSDIDESDKDPSERLTESAYHDKAYEPEDSDLAPSEGEVGEALEGSKEIEPALSAESELEPLEFGETSDWVGGPGGSAEGSGNFVIWDNNLKPTSAVTEGGLPRGMSVQEIDEAGGEANANAEGYANEAEENQVGESDDAWLNEANEGIDEAADDEEEDFEELGENPSKAIDDGGAEELLIEGE